MKRQSAAESALAKQVRGIDVQIDAQNELIARAQTRIDTLLTLRDTLATEMKDLAAKRLAASERRKYGDLRDGE